MSDGINNNNGEETAALFVSSQKKKQAEEEARKKAEAERAKRDAAEAEVRRMEAEVQERKRKAEDERRALEEAANRAETEKTNVAEKLDKSKLPIIIGVAVVAVAIIAVVIVLVIKGKKPAVDYETLEFAKEYTVTREDNSTVSILYPESMYTGFAETKEDGGTVLEAENADTKSPIMCVVVTDPVYEKGTTSLMSAKQIQSDFEQSLGGNTEQMTMTDVKTTDLEAETPGKYFYECTATGGDEIYALTAWMEPDSNGDYVAVMGIFGEKGTDPANVIKLRDTFRDKNSDNALMVPGANPPASADTDGMLEVDAMHMGIIVPKDRFRKVDTGRDDLLWWTDDNGAIYSIFLENAEFDFDMASEHLDEVQPMLKELAETAAGLKGLPDIDSRMFLKDNWENDLRYRSEYKDVFGGMTYWEGNYTSMWHDERTNQYYLYDLVLLAPNSNQDIYRQLFDKATDRMQDI